MPGEVIDRPNPEAEPSNLPDLLDQLQVKVEHKALDQAACDALYKFRRAASYIAAGESTGLGNIYLNTDQSAMIFLQDNVYLKRDLKHDDIKPRLLGKHHTAGHVIFAYS